MRKWYVRLIIMLLLCLECSAMTFVHTLMLIVLILLILWWFKNSIYKNVSTGCRVVQSWFYNKDPIPEVLYDQYKPYNKWMYFNAADEVVEGLSINTTFNARDVQALMDQLG